MRRPVFIVLLVLLLDQSFKFWVKTNMAIGDSFEVLGSMFQIHFIENPGMAFGLILDVEYGKLILSVFRILAVIAITYYMWRLTQKNAHKGLITSIALILAGALGNILDSAVYGLIFGDSHGQVASFMPEEGGYAGFLHGNVVDMLYFPLYNNVLPDWVPFYGGEHFVFFRPIFNLADSAITIGVGMIILFQKRYFALPKVESDTVPPEHVAEASTDEALHPTGQSEKDSPKEVDPSKGKSSL